MVFELEYGPIIYTLSYHADKVFGQLLRDIAYIVATTHTHLVNKR